MIEVVGGAVNTRVHEELVDELCLPRSRGASIRTAKVS